jgi:hypothetical protein
MTTMKHHHEHKISERVDEFCHTLYLRSAVGSKSVDFAEHLR